MGENEPNVKSGDAAGNNTNDPTYNDGKIAKGDANDLSFGPVKKRGCTDIFCLLIWATYAVFFLYLVGYAFKNGRATKLVYPRDFSGRSCGTENPSYLTIDGKSDLSDFSNLVLTVNVTEVYGNQALTMMCKSANRPTFLAKCGSDANNPNSCRQNLEGACTGVANISPLSINSVKSFFADLPNISEAAKVAKDSIANVDKYTQKTCITSCDNFNKAINQPNFRTWNLHFTEDIPWAAAWNAYMSDPTTTPLSEVDKWIAALDEINGRRALMTDLCPYSEKYCVFIPNPTKKLARYCLTVSALTVTSEKTAKLFKKTFNKFSDSEIGSAFGAIEETWWILPIVSIVAVVIGMIFLVVLRFTVAIMVWVSITLIFLSFSLSGTFMLLAYGKCENPDDNKRTIDFKCAGGEHVVEGDLRKYYLIASIVLLSAAFLYLVFVLCSCKAIRLAIKLNKVAARFVYTNKRIIILPMVQVVFITFWVAFCVSVCLYAISTSSISDKDEAKVYTFPEAGGTKKTPGACTDVWPKHVLWKDSSLSTCKCPDDGTTCDVTALKCWKCGPEIFNIGWRFWAILFEFFWTNSLIVAIGQTAVAGAVGVWYFNQHRLGTVSPTKTGVKNVFLYHLGSLAFGSFILAILKLVKWWLRYMKKQLQASKQEFMAKVAHALSYCVLCFERCIEFINQNAYIRIALTGENFCKAAWSSFKLILRNMGYYAVVGGLSHMMSYVGVFFITIGSSGLGYLILNSSNPELSPWVCVICYLILSALVAKAIMTVFELAVDTTLNCYLYDKEMGGGVAEHHPEELVDFDSNRPDNKE
eukprot:GEMP01007972.1.p1 GENE.GEMP01007972.1~~GEMP01007972.1.p1  ORF type:complete len:813 (+),score=91.18 GEMP01007972.1:202-2640(+)